jgi:hypothetical protein
MLLDSGSCELVPLQVGNALQHLKEWGGRSEHQYAVDGLDMTYDRMDYKLLDLV